MKVNQAAFTLASMCRVLYDWLRRPSSARARRDAELKDGIMAFWSGCDGSYGCPWIYAALRAEGERRKHDRKDAEELVRLYRAGELGN